MYLSFVAGEDIETQHNGIIFLFWPGLQKPKPPNSRFRRLCIETVQVFPVRIACIHMCFPSTKLFRMIRVLLSVVLKFGKVVTRVKVHSGMFWQDHKFIQIQFQVALLFLPPLPVM